MKQDYLGKKVVLAGYGVEGRSAYKYYDARGADITIADSNSDLKDTLGEKGNLASTETCLNFSLVRP